MRFNTITTIICLIFLKTTSGQKNRNIKGAIFDVAGLPVSECFIKLTDSSETKIFNYYFTGNTNTFSFVVDDIVVRSENWKLLIGKQGFINTIIPAINIIDSPEVSLKIYLRKEPKLLKGVTVKSSPVWQKGDTTFYRAGSYLDGTEFKLIDLIEKIPDFKIGQDGSLSYRNKPVEKILVGGEDIFANRQSLLLANFPSDRSNLTPTFDFNIDIKNQSVKMRNNLFFQFKRTPLQLFEKNTRVWAISPFNFRKYELENQNSITYFSLNYSLFRQLKKKQFISFILQHRTNFNSFISELDYQRIFQKITLILSKRTTSTNFVSLSYSIPLVKRLSIEVDVSHQQLTNLIEADKQIGKLRSNISTSAVTLEYNNVKHLIKLGGNYQILYTKNSLHKNQTSLFRQFGSSLEYRIKLSKTINFKADTKYLVTTSANRSSSYLFTNAQLNLKPEKKKWGISLQLDNVTNTRNYQLIYYQFPVSYYSEIPIFRRNAYIIFRYAF